MCVRVQRKPIHLKARFSEIRVTQRKRKNKQTYPQLVCNEFYDKEHGIGQNC